MSIRNRITLWFAAILLICLMVMAGVFRYELGESLDRARRGQPLDSAWEETGEFLLFIGLPTALLLLAGGSWLLRRSLRPLPRLTKAVAELHLHRLHERLPPLGTGDELDQLTEVFNHMTARLEASFAHVREFTLHASHELKTPLTIMQGELEAALDEPSLPPAQRELLAGQLDEVQRLARIVDSLTFLAKADSGQLPLRLEPTALAELVEDSYEDARMLARPLNIAVRLTACDQLEIRGDRHRLRQLLLNLTDNAIKHNQPNGRVEIALVRRAEWAALTVGNTGPGIPAEQLPRVFDRFFRGDAAHGTDKEGSGLGLAIAKWIAHAHGASIRIDSRPGDWTTVEVLLPLSAARHDDTPRTASSKTRTGS